MLKKVSSSSDFNLVPPCIAVCITTSYFLSLKKLSVLFLSNKLKLSLLIPSTSDGGKLPIIFLAI